MIHVVSVTSFLFHSIILIPVSLFLTLLFLCLSHSLPSVDSPLSSSIVPLFLHLQLKTYPFYKFFPPCTLFPAGLIPRTITQTVSSELNMVALCNRADHYIFMLWFVLLLLLFFPRLISAAADWMSAILPHMVWP